MRRGNKSRQMYGRHKRNHRIWRFTGVFGCLIVCLCAILIFQGFSRQKAEDHSLSSVLRLSSDSVLASDQQSGSNPEAEGDWKLILVNRWHKIPDGYQPELTRLSNGHAVDSRIYPKLQEMFDDARDEGILPEITSSFRTTEDQQRIMDEKISEYLIQGYSDSEAKELAGKWVAVPGTSEHQIGMAVDISTADAGRQDASIVWNWLNENSYRYGFILRYAEDKTEITGVMPEPWHYRYVGEEAAKEIYHQDICLEEYLERLH